MAAVIQRPLRGSRISTFYPVKNLPSLSSLDSAFQLQEYISLLIRLDVHDVEAITSLPGTSGSHKEPSGEDEKDKEKGKEKEDVAQEEDGATKDAEKEKEGEKGKSGEVSVDEACWIYEQLRRLAQDLSHPLITTLQQECTRASCPEMKAGEWLYLCVAHGNDGAMEQCCAIDYILHTVDSATALLNSPRTFPSRLSIPQTSHRHFSSLARRLGRIFAHAFFHHREAFEQAEAESSLYARFLALTSKFDLVPAEFLVIPPLASGSSSSQQQQHLYGAEEHEAGRDREHGAYGDLAGAGGRRYPTRFTSDLQQQPGQTPGILQQKYLQHHHQQQQQQHSSHPLSQHQHQLGAHSPRAFGDRALGSPGPGPNNNSSPHVAGDHPTSATRSRFGRSRTDTMVFADAEASAVADELAAKARAGELEPEPEPEPEPVPEGHQRAVLVSEDHPTETGSEQRQEGHEYEALKTAKPPAKELEPEREPVPQGEGEVHEAVSQSEVLKENTEVKQVKEEEEEEQDLETDFEISLSPNEEIPGSLSLEGIPTHLDEEKEKEEVKSEEHTKSEEPVLFEESQPAPEPAPTSQPEAEPATAAETPMEKESAAKEEEKPEEASVSPPPASSTSSSDADAKDAPQSPVPLAELVAPAPAPASPEVKAQTEIPASTTSESEEELVVSDPHTPPAPSEAPPPLPPLPPAAVDADEAVDVDVDEAADDADAIELFGAEPPVVVEPPVSVAEPIKSEEEETKTTSADQQDAPAVKEEGETTSASTSTSSVSASESETLAPVPPSSSTTTTTEEEKEEEEEEDTPPKAPTSF